jgi:hypothetical protein
LTILAMYDIFLNDKSRTTFATLTNTVGPVEHWVAEGI